MGHKASQPDTTTAHRWWAEVSGAESARRPASVVVVLTRDLDEGGYFLEGYDRNGIATLSTWHGAMPAAKGQATSEHAPADVGAWHAIPNAIDDPVSYALRRGRR